MIELQDLERHFNDVKRKEYKGIKGVEIFDSGKPGPTVGITVQTHGNEPTGLAVYPYLKKLSGSKRRFLKGKIYFIVNNLLAAEKYFEACREKDEGKMEKSRSVDVNMNRLPEEKLADEKCLLYEVVRVRELMPLWSEFDYALDLHSTSQKSNPMIVALDRSDLDLIEMFPFRDVLTNIEAVQLGTPASALYGKPGSSVFGLETGQHTHYRSFEKAKLSVKALLSLLGMIEYSRFPKKVEKHVYRVFDSVIPKNKSFRLARTFKTYQPINKGQLIATTDYGNVIAKEDCLALFGRKASDEVHLNEEALFLVKKVIK